jgi:hypothetical protein
MLRHLPWITFAALAALGVAARDSHAQAWVGEPGSLDATLDFNLAMSDKVVGAGMGVEFANAGTTTQQLALRAEYTIIDRLAADITLPMVRLTYTGKLGMYPHNGGGTYDDGNAHMTLTDLLLRARYQVLAEPFALAPHLGVSIPLADYETVGNTVAGRHITAAHAGVGIGRVIADTFYLHLLYDFTYGQKYNRTTETAKYNQNASDFSLTIGDKLMDGKLDINIDAQYHRQHGGISFNDFGTRFGVTSDEVTYHDPILHESMFLVGAGVGYGITDSITIALALRFWLSGENTQNANVYGLSLTWAAL